MARIAFYTFGLWHSEIEHAAVQEFAGRIDSTFAAAAAAPGLIDHWRHDKDWGQIVHPRFFEAARPYSTFLAASTTLSLWRDVEAVRAFVYAGLHLEALQHRGEWFQAREWPTYVAWWVEDDETPTWREACERLEHLHDHGASAYAFDFKHPYDAAGRPIQLSLAR
jgi:hypothetical protein